VTNWFDDPEDGRPSSDANKSWMRLYIAAALIGLVRLSVVGGMLHILPA
jgi:hypothetical protein